MRESLWQERPEVLSGFGLRQLLGNLIQVCEGLNKYARQQEQAGGISANDHFGE